MTTLACPECKSINTAMMIYGYTDDSDQELNDRYGKDLYLAGCVPDRFGKLLNGEWIYPKRHCNDCKIFYDYAPDNEVLCQSPDDSSPRTPNNSGFTHIVDGITLLLKQYAKEKGVIVRSTSDLSELEQWLLMKLIVIDKE